MARRRTLKSLLLLVGGLAAACLLAVPIQSQGPGRSQGPEPGLYKGREVVAREVLVKLREHAQPAPMPLNLDVDQDEQIGDGSVRRIHSRSHSVETLLARLSESADVEYAEPNYILYADADTVPDDKGFEFLWGLLNTGQTIGDLVGKPGADISAVAAWGITTGDAANVVAVVDTGIDYMHPDLAANVWAAPPGFSVTIGGVTINCAAGTHGFNAIKKNCDPMDDNNHGTHVSGTIGAKGNNGIGVVGVNWTASLMGLKFLNSRGSGSTSDAVNAIEFAIQAKQKFGAGANVRVLSNSWGGGAVSQTLLDKIKEANSAGMIFVASAGNSGRNIDQSPSYPASYGVPNSLGDYAPNVLAVAATDNTDTLASWSSYGVSSVGLAAPGVDIYSTLRGSKYGWMSGTSMAAPHVSGAAALVLSVPVCSNLAPADLKSVLVGYSDAIEGLKGKVTTGGRLNLDTAVRMCATVPVLPGPPPDFSIAATPTSQSVPRGQPATYVVTVTPVNNFTGAVSFSVTSSLPDPTIEFVPSTLNYPDDGNETTLYVTPGPTTKTQGWTYILKITATSGGLVHTTTVRLSATR